jgi:toxin ParE1/3/4
MAKPILHYELSEEADNDLENIFDYTANEWGVAQAFVYVTAFDVIFENLSANPEPGHERNEIREGLRSFVKESHVIFYRILKDHIRIVRILHKSRDVIKFL